MASVCFAHHGVVSQLHFTKCKGMLSESLQELAIWSEASLHSFQGFQNTESHSSRKDSLAGESCLKLPKEENDASLSVSW